jgi:hypothetical protein
MSGIIMPGRIRSQIEPSYTIVAANDAEKTTASNAWVQVKEIRLDGWVDVEKYNTRVRFKMHGTGGWTAHGKLQRNGTDIGTPYSTASGVYVTFDQDTAIECVDGDLLQLIGYIDHAGETAYFKEFEIMGTITQHIRSLDEACAYTNTMT